MFNSVEVLKYLISKGADANAKSYEGQSVLQAVEIPDVDEKKRILQKASGCLVLLAALGDLLISGVCGLALFIATAWKF